MTDCDRCGEPQFDPAWRYCLCEKEHRVCNVCANKMRDLGLMGFTFFGEAMLVCPLDKSKETVVAVKLMEER